MSKKYLFVACEHGSFNAIYPVLKELSKKEAMGYMGIKDIGDMPLILKKIIDPMHDIDNQTLSEFDVFVTGSSCYSMVEYNIWKYARANDKRSICVLDQWKNYRGRFVRNSEVFCPDIICVMDEISKQGILGAGLGIDAKRVVITGSPYLDALLMKREALRPEIKRKKVEFEGKKVITFFTECMLKDKEKTKYGYDESDILNDLIAFIEKRKDDFVLMIKLHPSDDKTLYTDYLSYPFIRIQEIPPIEAILVSDVTVGANSMALLESYLLGVPTVSYQPNAKKEEFVLDDLGVQRVVKNPKELETKIIESISGKYVFKEFYKPVGDSVKNICAYVLGDTKNDEIN